eukprot:CAMPEP_0201489272 /NCGR_PEP_ID=MMETSP0151_2-20130828/21669_1 /ASSEMBLY_ACC=CAM_ASM_000257 /TAXON_ID=200890 /ORGANISM="Paramoeba atlantica, Strain 621/1 / CCAP 1560/9" /LENGTH=243 /DNA_ID=CAMNT_0047874807 /DNA_START=13 /DNA_END=744 /DNA_ORIENTATION=-
MAAEDDRAFVQGFLENRKDLRGVGCEKQWRLLLKAKEIDHVLDVLAERLNTLFEGKDVVITCILKGAVYFLVDLTRRLKIPYSVYFLEASSYKHQKQGETVEMLSKIIPSKFVNKHVLLVDELWDNGKTLESVKNHLIEKIGHDKKDVSTCTLFLKEKNPNVYPLPNLYGLVLPNVWVVGYGLDDNQEKRGWEHLFGIPKIEGIPKGPDDDIFEEGGEEKYLEMRKNLKEAALSTPTFGDLSK